MRKLVKGIIEFRRNVLPHYRETFARLALGQSPDTLFIACSDSRVVVNLFASTHPGDLFVIRNVGNLIPPCSSDGFSVGDEAEGAAIEFALLQLKVKDIVVCGHSECGAIQAICTGQVPTGARHLHSWLRHGQASQALLENDRATSPELSFHNRVSQLNVLQQMTHLLSYPTVKERVSEGSLRVHGWWFDIAQADVYAFEEKLGQFSLLDETAADAILSRIHP